MDKQTISVKAEIAVPIEKVWKCLTTPDDIVHWNNASDDWHTPHAVNDLRVGGTFSYRMEARDGSLGFDFGGIYDQVILHKKIEYTLGDGRKVKIALSSRGGLTEVIETFEAENVHPMEIQRSGWQAILDHFKDYTEAV